MSELLIRRPITIALLALVTVVIIVVTISLSGKSYTKVDPIPFSKRPLSAASQTLDDLREGKITGRVILTP